DPAADKDLFIALNELVSEKKIRLDDVEIRFYTGELPWLKKEIKEYNLENTAYVYEKVSRREIIKRQSESQVLLIIYWGEKKEKGWQSLKIFGYLAALRPILVTNGASGDVVERMIEETKSGAYCRNIAEIKDNLEKYYFDYKKTGEVSYHGDIEMVKKHSYDKKAEELANILNRLMR
ncbi:MAG: hypothetical protein NTW46_03715, partial [Candidatus Nealsonbacteria bacterium]|nr:hypothetical protein [Candidatus Nealsonbacteria bacterium]